MPDRRLPIALLTFVLPAVMVVTSRTVAVTQGPDDRRAIQGDGIPHGTVTKYRWTRSTIFPGTERDYWVYVPAQYDGQLRPA